MKTMKRILIAVCLLTCVGCQHGMVKLETGLPSGKVDQSQKDRPKQSGKFLVPRGTKLLSLDVKVTSSDRPCPVIGELEMITDGEKQENLHGIQRDSIAVELMETGLQWVQLDLGKPHALHAILVWHYLGWKNEGEYSIERRIYEDVVVQVSNDPAFKKDVITVFNNDQDNSAGFGKGKDDPYLETFEGCWINPKGVKGRYVRLYSRGYTRQRWSGKPIKMTTNNYIEVEVYGK